MNRIRLSKSLQTCGCAWLPFLPYRASVAPACQEPICILLRLATAAKAVALGCPIILPCPLGLVNRVLKLSSCACRLPRRQSGLRLALSCQHRASLSRGFLLVPARGLPAEPAALGCRADKTNLDRFRSVCQAPIKTAGYAIVGKGQDVLHSRKRISDRQAAMAIAQMLRGLAGSFAAKPAATIAAWSNVAAKSLSVRRRALPAYSNGWQ